MKTAQTMQTIQPVVSTYAYTPANQFNTFNTGYANTITPNYGAGYVNSPFANVGVGSSFVGTQSFGNSNQFMMNDIDQFRNSLIGQADRQRMAFQTSQNDPSNSYVVSGSGNIAAGNGHLIGGNQNSVYGLDLSVLGNGNAVKGASSTIIGNENSLLKGR